VAAVLVVVAVAGVFLGLRGRTHSAGPAAAQGVQVVFTVPAGAGRLERTAGVLRARLRAVFGRAEVAATGGGLVATVPDAGAGARAEVIALAAPGQFAFYDWESNVLLPHGKTVASQLAVQDPLALEVSQGAAGASPGAGDAGGLPLAVASALAASQKSEIAADNLRLGSEYFILGAPGSQACALGAAAHGVADIRTRACLLAGPVSGGAGPDSALPAGVKLGRAADVITVHQGITVVKAFGSTGSFADPSARFFVLRDHAALEGNEITDPKVSTDPNTGEADVTFGFTARGQRAFQAVTAQIARRGTLVSGLGATLNQHFAMVLDDQILSVPSIDFRQYPDGISGADGADITGFGSPQTARIVAAVLRYGPLPALQPQR
jgi:hypothetical protein